MQKTTKKSRRSDQFTSTVSESSTQTVVSARLSQNENHFMTTKRHAENREVCIFPGMAGRRMTIHLGEVPLTAENAVTHKANESQNSRCGFFVESNPILAAFIQLETSRP